MNNNRIILILFAVMILLTVSFASVSAQNVDVENMDNEQLTTLLLQILSKLQQEEGPEKEAPDTAAEAAAVPAAEPKSIEEIVQITIYDNKKLQIESLPSYMFIQPTQQPKPDKNPDENPDEKDTGPVPGTVCDPDSPNFCFWTSVGGEVKCVCSELG